MKREPRAAEDYVSISEAREVSQTSHALLVPAIIFIVQILFVEFAMKRVCHLVDPNFRPASRGLIAACTGFLKRKKVIEQMPREFEERIFKKIDVRNDFAHGDWLALETKLNKVDLYEIFEAVGKYLWAIKEGLESRGYNII